MFQRILVAADSSTLSRKAVDTAVRLAAGTRAELFALHVVPRYPLSYFEGAAALSPQDIAHTEQAWAGKGRALVDAVVQQARAAGVAAHALLTQTDGVAESVIASAGKHGCDLIVMASHGRRGIGRVLLGSETQHVLTHSRIPVLVLR